MHLVLTATPLSQVSFDQQCQTYPIPSESTKAKEMVFPIGNVSADINILVKDEYTVGSSPDVLGVVVLPLSRYMGVTAPTVPKMEWFQFFPYAEVVALSGGTADNTEQSSVILRSGDVTIPGSAMNKSKHSIGFVCVQVEVFLIEPAYKLYLKSFHPASRWNDNEV